LGLSLYRCACCGNIFSSNEILRSHQNSQHLCRDTYRSDAVNPQISHEKDLTAGYIPPNVLKLPVLPLIETERTVSAFEYKLPMTPRLFDLLYKEECAGINNTD
jgi:hypothetical protein